MPLPVKRLPKDIILLVLGFLGAQAPKITDLHCRPDTLKNAKSKNNVWQTTKLCSCGQRIAINANLLLQPSFRIATLPRCYKESCRNTKACNAYLARVKHTASRKAANPLVAMSLYLHWYENYCMLLLAGQVPRREYNCYINVAHALECYHYCRLYASGLSYNIDNCWSTEFMAYSPAKVARCVGELYITRFFSYRITTRNFYLAQLYKDPLSQEHLRIFKRPIFHRLKGVTEYGRSYHTSNQYRQPIDNLMIDFINKVRNLRHAPLQIYHADRIRPQPHIQSRFTIAAKKLLRIMISKRQKNDVLECFLVKMQMIKRTEQNRLRYTSGNLELVYKGCEKESCACRETVSSENVTIPIPYQLVGYPLLSAQQIITLRVRGSKKHHRFCCISSSSGLYLIHVQYSDHASTIKSQDAYRVDVTYRNPNFPNISMRGLMTIFWDAFRKTDSVIDVQWICRNSYAGFCNKFDLVSTLSMVKKSMIVFELPEIDNIKHVHFTKM